MLKKTHSLYRRDITIQDVRLSLVERQESRNENFIEVGGSIFDLETGRFTQSINHLLDRMNLTQAILRQLISIPSHGHSW